MAYTNTGLVEYCKKILALGEDTVYMWGSFGQRMTASLIEQKCNQYPNQNGPRRTAYIAAMNTTGIEYAWDCVGLIKSYVWDWNNGSYNYAKNGMPDVNDTTIYNNAKVKGPISTMPEIPGLGLHMNGHVGVYIGNGYVIESTSSTRFANYSHGLGGVCKTKLSDRKWEHWFQVPAVTYEINKYEPIGNIDHCSCSGRTVKVSGWAFDKDSSSKSIKVKVYINGASAKTILTEDQRDDVNKAYGISGVHGFSCSFSTELVGEQTIIVKAVDSTSGKEKEIGKKKISIKGSILNCNVGDIYNITRDIKVYTNATNAANKINSTATYKAGSYYIYKISNGIVNISKTKGVPGGWINPSDL